MADLISTAIQRALGGQTPAPPRPPARWGLPGQDPGPLNLPTPVEINDPGGQLTGKYAPDLFRQIVDAARQRAIDPLTALAVAGQESAFGRHDAENPLRLRLDLHGVPADASTEDLIGKSLDYFKTRTARQRRFTPHDEELILQSYNGLGKIQGGSEIHPDQPMYGGQLGLTGAKDRPYGKRLIEIRKMLATQPSIKALLGLDNNHE